MLRSLGIVSAVMALTLALPGAAFANDSDARSSCHIVDKSGGLLLGSVNIVNAPAETRALATAYFAAGQNFSLNGVLLAPGTPIGVPVSREFDPNDPVDVLALQAPFATQATGELLVVIESASVFWPKTGETEWQQNGSKSFASAVNCEIMVNTVTQTVTKTQVVQLPAQAPEVETRTVFVHIDHKPKTKIVKIKVIRYRHDKNSLTCARGDRKGVVYKPATHHWYNVCYHQEHIDSKVTG